MQPDRTHEPARRSAAWKRGIAFGLLAALLFGASTPAAKHLLGDVRPQLLAGLLYGGAALLLFVTRPWHGRRAEARLRRSDAPLLTAIVISGGIVAPVALLVGLDRISAVSGDPVGACDVVAGLAMAGGVGLLVTDQHRHSHRHTGLVHDHRHPPPPPTPRKVKGAATPFPPLRGGRCARRWRRRAGRGWPGRDRR